jgi:RecA-family ATPase
MTDAETREHRERIEAMRRIRNEDKAQRQHEASDRADRIWREAQPAPAEHEYLARKGIMSHGVRIHDGRLIVPLRDIAGTLHSLQLIATDGSKKFLTGGRVKECFYTIGKAGSADTLVIVEGYATAASVNETTGLPTVATFSAGNLLPVAQALRNRYPQARIVIVADNDVKTDGNPGVQAARAAADAVNGVVVIPNAIDGRATDANDLALAHGPDAVREIIDAALPTAPQVWQPPEPITPDEWTGARLTPDCIVENYLFADVGVLIAPGGTGKTTLTLYEATHIALGLPLYGLRVFRAGPVVILTAEDSREMLVARLRRITEALSLTPDQLDKVRSRVLISDVSGEGLRLTEMLDDVVRPSVFADTLADRLRDLAPVVVVIDPAVSFGVGESRVNDAEQGLIEAARRLRRALNCCIRYVHHSGKQNARDKTTDQYSGRGGSAFADGARMVHVLQPLDASAWHKATGTDLTPGDSGLILARPKISYCPPQGDILLQRFGYLFEQVEAAESDPMGDLQRDAETILAAVRELDRPTQNTLTAMNTGLSRDRTRAVIRCLLDDGRLEYRENTQRGGAQKYLAATAAVEPHTYRAPCESDASEETPENDPSCAAAYREEKTRAPTRGLSSPDPKVSGSPTRAPTAQLAHLDGESGESWEGEL